MNYLKHDSIGRIANAHLACSDLYGIKAKVNFCLILMKQQYVQICN